MPRMPRRRALQLVSTSLATAIAGCTNRGSPTDTPGSTTDARTTRARTTATSRATGTPTSTRTRSPESTRTSEPPETPGDWDPAWQLDVRQENVLGIDADPARDRLYLTLDGQGPAAVGTVDPAAKQFAWRTSLPGEVRSRSYDDPLSTDDGWGVTRGDGRVYLATGKGSHEDEETTWSELHALDADDGGVAWTIRRERLFGVLGIRDRTLFLLGWEFPPAVGPEQQPPPQPATLYAVNTRDGTVRWTASFERAETGAVGPAATYVAVGSKLVAVDETGSRRWTRDFRNTARQMYSVGEFVYDVREDGQRSVVRGLAPDGTVRWSRTVRADRVVREPGGRRLFLGGDATLALAPDGSRAWRRNAYGGGLLLHPSSDTLFTRTGKAADAVGAYRTADGAHLFDYDPPSNNAGPAAATDDWLVAWALTSDDETTGFYSLFAVARDDASAYGEFGAETLFTVESLDGVFYVGTGSGTLYALEPPVR